MSADACPAYEHDPQADRRRWCWAGALLVLSAIIFLANSATLPVSDPDESRCAAIVSTMLRTGNWLMPRLEGEPYYDKPAPFFWLAAAVHRITNSIEPGGRLIAGLAGIACVMVTFSFARRYGGDFGGFLAGGILAGGPEFVYTARWYRMDMPLVAAMWAALWWFWRYEGAQGVAGRGTWRQWLGFYGFAGLATLMKGPAGLALPAMILAAYFLFSGQTRRILSFLNPAGLAVFVAIVGPYYAAVCYSDPQYARHFFLEQNLGRYADESFNHHTLYGVGYLAVLAVGMAPWSVYLPGTFGRGIKQAWRQRRNHSHVTFLWIATLVPLVFFCLSMTQLPNYIVPCFAPLAVLMGLQIAHWVRRSEVDRLFAHGANALCIVLAILLAVVTVSGGLASAYLVGGKFTFQPWMPALAVAVLAVIAMMIRHLRRMQRKEFLLYGLCANFILLLATFYCVFPSLYGIWSFRDMAQAARCAGSDPAGSVSICSWGSTKHSLALYAGAERLFRIPNPPVASMSEVVDFLSAKPNSFCLLADEKYIDQLRRKSGRRVQIVHHKWHYYLVRLD